ncbi:LacI family DNA-binding transcriptional regulator [Parenemella sanctibonifatiensis]|uniref:LacI family transcriptional regulator n=1 Tax=Parenemella sanctibonifatiensis TaxID=2016505 RepID=A0A255E719_9ACTN|nr:LacI family DNA-binding transcriptional regulator [Parenemella sanctibonifatiensis]OYN85295.1 LacI family transcriptional regulator [Parenemella sanctibonifatiensis]
MATIKDVARRAGVSPATVSRALANPSSESVTHHRVRRAAADLGYRPNRAAQRLIGGRTGLVAVLVADLANPFFAEVVKAIQSQARTLGNEVVVSDTDEQVGRELEALQSLASQVDGLILCAPRSEPADLEALQRAHPGLGIVLVNRELEGWTSVSVDMASAMERVVANLVALGHRRIAYADGPAGSWAGARRREGLERAAAREGVEVLCLGAMPPTHDGGRQAADLVVASGATAVVAFDDLVGLGVVNRLRRHGIDVPGQVSVVGCDDIPLASVVDPALTTVAVPRAELGRSAMELLSGLLERVDEDRPRPLPRQLRLSADLVVRASTGLSPHQPAPDHPSDSDSPATALGSIR